MAVVVQFARERPGVKGKTACTTSGWARLRSHPCRRTPSADYKAAPARRRPRSAMVGGESRESGQSDNIPRRAPSSCSISSGDKAPSTDSIRDLSIARICWANATDTTDRPLVALGGMQIEPINRSADLLDVRGTTMTVERFAIAFLFWTTMAGRVPNCSRPALPAGRGS